MSQTLPQRAYNLFISDVVTHTNNKKDDLPPSSVTVPCRGAGRINYDLWIFYLSHINLCFLIGRRKSLRADIFYRTILKWLCSEAVCLGHGGALWRLLIKGIQVKGEKNSPPFWPGLVQAPWALLTKCPLCLAGDGGRSPRGKAGATSHSLCCSSGDPYSGTALSSSQSPWAPCCHWAQKPLWSIRIRCCG